MINTFYRCIFCASDEADYDELLAVRLVCFLTEHVEEIMAVPKKLSLLVTSTLDNMQREKVLFSHNCKFERQNELIFITFIHM